MRENDIYTNSSMYTLSEIKAFIKFLAWPFFKKRRMKFDITDTCTFSIIHLYCVMLNIYIYIFHR